MERALIDGHGRRITYVRISVTDRCNLRCIYCMPEDQKFRPLPHLLSRDEIRRTARLLADFGIEKIRITGGEPTTRPDLVDIVRDLAEIGFPGGIALSTNGVLFPRMAHDLLAAGLSKVNVSLDAAEAEHFRKMTRRDHFKPVVDSIALALSLPFDSVKINAVVIRGLNDDQILPLAAMTKDKKLGVRFIEFMPFGDNDWKESDWVGWEELGTASSPPDTPSRRFRRRSWRDPPTSIPSRRPPARIRARSVSSRPSRTGSVIPATACASRRTDSSRAVSSDTRTWTS